MTPCRLFGFCVVAGGSFICLLASTAHGQQKQLPPEQVEYFEKSVRPILANHCLECHGPEKHKASLRLDSRATMMSGGVSGPAIVPGSPKDSLLITAIHYVDNPKMPPTGKLGTSEIAVLTEWIKQGAPWPETAGAPIRAAAAGKAFKITAADKAFWAFQAVAKVQAPDVKDAAWATTPIDRFVLAGLHAQKFQPNPVADRRTLIRRATFDLIGLPPTPAEIDAFINDKSPDAFAKVIDRLLASPQYGERWARHWLDVARYAEDQAHTFEARKYPNGFRYRDWLVKAYNTDMPYDQFLIEQIAADLLPGKRVEHLPALGFFATGPVYYGDGKKLDQIDDRIDTLTRGLLGLTVACARCHDHKFDPISTKDYYSLAGVIASTDYVELSLEPGKEGQPLPKLPKDKKEAKDVKKEQAKLPFIHALQDVKPVTMKVHVRGNPKTLGEDAPRRFLEILGGKDSQPFKNGSGRLELAQAIASKDNPLTARVMVNRIWQHHFGRALVGTPSNFGVVGERPSHPELLDYLAAKFVASGWSMKAMHREIMLSATYQMSSGLNAKYAETDPENKWLWRMNRQRLEVEAWRDAILAVSGILDTKMGGSPMDLNNDKNNRRTLYGSVSRHDLNSLLRLFDFPDPNITSEKRTTTTVPLQQLFVLNSEFMVRNSKALAARLQKQNGSDADRIRKAYPLVLGRDVTEKELALGLAFLAAPKADNAKTALTRWEQYAQVLLSTNEFLYVD